MYNKSVRIARRGIGVTRRFISLILLPGAFFLSIKHLAHAETFSAERLRPLIQALESRNLAAYLEFCQPEIKEEEEKALRSYFSLPDLESVSSFFAGENQSENGVFFAYVQVVFQRIYSVNIELWEMVYSVSQTGPLLRSRRVLNSLKDLYRLRFPGERTVPVRNVRLVQQDILITFSEGYIFFDNLPGIDTAVIITGRGRVRFEPSDPIEKNQLARIYRNPYFDQPVEYVYVRGGDEYFRHSLMYEPCETFRSEVPAEVMNNRAYSIFSRNYSRSFVLENSLTGELLTFIPRGGETVIEFRTAKKDEFTYVYSPFAEEEISFVDRTRKRLLNSYSPVEAGQRRMFMRLGERYEITGYEIEASYRPENHLLAAMASVSIKATGDYADSCQFRLNPDLEILKVEDEAGRTLFYSRDRLRKYTYVYLAEKLPRDGEIRLKIFYRGKIVPPPPVTDSGPRAQVEETRILFPISETYLFSQSADWYPAPPREKYVRFRLKLIVPESYYCLSGGRLVESYQIKEAAAVTELASLGSSVFVYESRSPVKYISFFLGKLVKQRKLDEPLPLEHFATDDWRHQNRQILDEASKILSLYQEFFGPFPFEKLTVVQRYWQANGGHASPGLVVLDRLPYTRTPDLIIISQMSPVDLSRWPEYFLAHEIAHQWWGHGLTWGSYRDNWITEGLAQLSSILYLEKKYSRKDFEKVLQKLSSSVLKKTTIGPIILGSRLSHIDFEGYQSVVYNKAALALLLLREWLGEETFYRGLREFFQEFRFQPVRTADFRRTMERVSGKNLEQFFQGWFFSERLPRVRVERKVVSSGTSTSSKLLLSFYQMNQPLVFPVRVAVESERERTEKVLLLESSVQTFEIEISGRLKKIKINSDNMVPGYFE